MNKKLKAIIKQQPIIKATLQSTGPRGKAGKSAYEIWLEQGNSGSEQDFLDSLKASEMEYSKLQNKPTLNGGELVKGTTLEDVNIVPIDEEDIKRLF